MADTSNTPKWLTVDEAWDQLRQAVPELHLQTEEIGLAAALGRVLAERPLSQVNVPPADNSAMDGFAVSRSNLVSESPVTLPISQRIPAGAAPQLLTTDSAVRIFTGSEVPEGADTVIMQENCDYDDTQVTINKLPALGSNIRHSGEDIKADQPLLAKGHRLRPQDLGLLAAAGIASVSVYRPLQVAVIATGDELIPPGQPLAPGQIYESNSPMVAGLLSSIGCEVTTYRAPDNLERTVELLQQASSADAIITIGGVSVGEEDHVKTALNQLGETGFWKIGLKPGKPFVLGHIGDLDGNKKPLLGLPGNPVSAFITFTLFCKPFLESLQGKPFTTPRHWRAKAGFDIGKPNTRQQYLRAILETNDQGENIVKLLPGQGSAVQSALCKADVLAVIPVETTVNVGEMIDVISLSELIDS